MGGRDVRVPSLPVHPHSTWQESAPQPVLPILMTPLPQPADSPGSACSLIERRPRKKKSQCMSSGEARRRRQVPGARAVPSHRAIPTRDTAAAPGGGNELRSMNTPFTPQRSRQYFRELDVQSAVAGAISRPLLLCFEARNPLGSA